MTKGLSYWTTVLMLLASQVGSVIVVRADNPAVKVGQADQADFSCYLPVVLRAPSCLDFFDDFSNSASGWYVGEDNKFLAEYLNGEYRLVVKKTYSSYIIDAPTCKRQNYVVEMDARWAGADNMGVSYGLMLGVMGNPRQYYLFEVKADIREFTVSHYGQGGWEVIVDQASTAIHAGTASNHLKVTHDGNSFTAEVNGTAVYTWTDTAEPGEKGVGLIVLSYPNQGNADARFDNYRVTDLSG